MKKTIIFAALAIFTILLISSASAFFLACFNKGSTITYCNKYANYNRCHNYDGCIAEEYTERCMFSYNEIKNCYYQGANYLCNSLPKECSVSDDTSFNLSAPNLTINTPVNNQVYDSKSILLDISLDKKADLYYSDNSNKPSKYTILCNDCYYYNRQRSFKEGFNNITFRAVDIVGNKVYETRTFNIDSKIPRIHKTEPRSGYADGNFEVQYSEENLKRITLFYGNTETGFRGKTLTNCTKGEKKWCSFVADLEDYDNEKIQYYFEVEDIADAVKKSQIRQNLNVDTTFPVLNNPGSYYIQGTGLNSRYIYFNFSVTEKNLDKITYSYKDSKNKTRELVLCSRLGKDNLCKARKSFAEGSYSVDIQITDRAGNAIAEHMDFEVDY